VVVGGAVVTVAVGAVVGEAVVVVGMVETAGVEAQAMNKNE
jgi:hypothetical protein